MKPFDESASSRPPSRVAESPQEVGIVGVRRRAPSAVDPERATPGAPARGRIDHGDRPGPGRDQPTGDDVAELTRSDPEPIIDRCAVRGHPIVIRPRREEQETARCTLRAPAETPRSGKCLALVPAEAPLDLTEIMDLGLELDDEQRAGLGVEGEDIDPASRTVAADFDLAGGRPVARSQATYGVCGHPRVCPFALSRPIADVRRLDPNDEASAKIVLGATDSMPR